MGNETLSSTIQYFSKNVGEYLELVSKLHRIYGRAIDTLRSCSRILLAHVKMLQVILKNL